MPPLPTLMRRAGVHDDAVRSICETPITRLLRRFEPLTWDARRSDPKVLLGLQNLRAIVSDQSAFEESDVHALAAGLPRLEELALGSCPLAPDLVALKMRSTEVPAASLNALRPAADRLRRLDLEACTLTEDATTALASLHGLEHLSLQSTELRFSTPTLRAALPATFMEPNR